MIIILPNEVNGLKQVQNNLHRLDLEKTLRYRQPVEVELYLPKFRIESTMDLQEALEKVS